MCSLFDPRWWNWIESFHKLDGQLVWGYSMQSIITAYWKTIENHYSFIILVVAANPLVSSPLKLVHEVKTIKEALKRFRKRDNFVVEYCLAATPSELSRALLDFDKIEIHLLPHMSETSMLEEA